MGGGLGESKQKIGGTKSIKVGRVAQFDKLTALSEVEGKLPDTTTFVGQSRQRRGTARPTLNL